MNSYATEHGKDRFGELYKEDTGNGRQENFFINLYHKYKKPIRIILPIILVLLAVFYLYAFFQKGIIFYDNFLKRSVVGEEILYNATPYYGDITIKVAPMHSNEYKISYEVPDNEIQSFMVHISEEVEYEQDVKIYSVDNKLLFDGKYRSNNSYFLFDKNGHPFMEDGGVSIVYSNSTTTHPFENFKPSFSHMICIINEKEVVFRGNFLILLFALLLLGLTAFDMKFPLAFFKMNHFLDVRDPEPTDFYIAMQRVTWVIMPIIAIICLILALFIR
ncbi:MAG: hypothetical protein RR444_08160 [Oscillospiraceae bacterium]